MTFDQIRSEVLERMSLSSSDASTRVGAAINRHYKRITSLLGMETTRYLSTDVVMTPGVRTATVPGVEKVDRVADITSQLRPLTEVSLHQMRTLEPTTSAPQVWALSHTQAQAVVLMFDTFPDFAWTLRIDGWTTLTDLTGAGEPAFSASFHDILTWFVLAEELLRKEKSPLAQAYEQKALGLLEDLRFHLADTHTRTLRQGTQPGGATGGSGQGGGGGAPGGAQYLTNIPPGTVVGRASDQGTGNSQPITTGPHLLMTGSVLDAVGYIDNAALLAKGYVDKTGTPAAMQLALFADADTVQGDPKLFFDGSLQVRPVAGVIGLVVQRPLNAVATASAIRLHGYSPALELLDKDGVQNYYIGIDDNDNDAFVIGPGYGSGQALTPLLKFPKGGNAPLVLPAGRIRFPVTAVPDPDPYTLDDYREGTWAPTFQGSGGQSGQVYAANTGTYAKKGKDVFCTGQIVLSTLGTISGTLQIGPLPVPPAGDVAGALTVAWFANLGTPLTWLTGMVEGGSLKLMGTAAAASALDALTQAHLTSSTYFYFAVHYIAAN